jgi:hypothetical protein
MHCVYVACVCNLVVVAVEGVRSSRPAWSELLGLDVLLAATDAAEPLLQIGAYTLATTVAASNAGSFGFESLGWDDSGRLVMAKAFAVTVTARGHFGARVAEGLMVLQGLFNSVRWLALAFEIIWMVFLKSVSG